VLDDVLDDVDSRQRTLTVFNYDGSETLTRNVERYFGFRNVTVTSGETSPDAPRNYLVLHDDDRVVASSNLDEVRDHLLAESPRDYVTGDVDVTEARYPAVLTNLDETFVTVSGERKLLMTKLSRFIEARALAHGDGTLRAGFQQLSRLDDEHGTASVYRRLADAGVDTHVYGHPGGSPAALAGLTAHGHETEELRWTWFVVYRVPDRPDLAAALVAERRGEGFSGFWTFDEETVERVDAYLDRAY
jgi:hypothetical protein